MTNLSQEEKREHQRRVIDRLHHEHDHPVSMRSDTQIGVFVRHDGDKLRESRLSVFPYSDYEPYHIDSVFPLPDEDYHAAWILLSPDWGRLEEDDEE